MIFYDTLIIMECITSVPPGQLDIKNKSCRLRLPWPKLHGAPDCFFEKLGNHQSTMPLVPDIKILGNLWDKTEHLSTLLNDHNLHMQTL